MIVEATVYYWTSSGMTTSITGWSGNSFTTTAYLEKTNVERLLEEAHRRGVEEGIERAKAVLRGTPA